MTWHLLYLWHNMHCMWHLTHDLWYHNPLSIPSVYYISINLIISDSTSTVSQSAHPDYWSYDPHGMYDNTGTICVTSYEYIWHHIHSLRYHTTLWHSHTLYSCHHTQDTCHRIHCSWAITYSVLIIAHLPYLWYKTHYMYHIIWSLYDITTTLSDITRLYSWQHIHSIHDNRPTVYDITYTLLVTSQPL